MPTYVSPMIEILQYTDPKLIEKAARVCYKSEDKMTENSHARMIKMLIKRGHTAMLEHGTMTVKLRTNRGITHELVRHRLASFAQESTRYVSYVEGPAFIKPLWYSNAQDEVKETFDRTLDITALRYCELVGHGLLKPEEAREILPNATAAEIVITANYREWRHIFNLRAVGTTGRPHPEMERLMGSLLRLADEKIPHVFEDILEAYENKKVD